MSGLADARFSSNAGEGQTVYCGHRSDLVFEFLVVLEGSAGGRLAFGHHARHTRQHHSNGKIRLTPLPWT